jgi:hypothetical protein
MSWVGGYQQNLISTFDSASSPALGTLIGQEMKGSWTLRVTDGETLRKTDAGRAEFQRLLNRAFACCDHVVELDLKKRYTEQANDLQKRLKDLKKSHKKAIGAKASKPDPDPAYA